MSKTGSKASEAAKVLNKLGASKGGTARAASLSPEERSEIARNAVQARWNKPGSGRTATVATPKATHTGILRIGSIEIPCYILADGRRLISKRGMVKALGMKYGSTVSRADPLTAFASQKALEPLFSKHLPALGEPIVFLPPHGGNAAHGYEAIILHDICEAVLSARKEGLLQQRQVTIADQCEMLVRGFARVGIIALVDEATGYQEARAKDALAKILESFIAKELQAYIDAFPSSFYQELFRLRGLAYPQDSVKRPQYFGCLTNDIVYKRLAPGVLDELKRVTPRRPTSGTLKHKYYQRLTSNLGFPKLKEHLGSVVAIMRLSTNWADFMDKLDRLHPRYGDTRKLSFPDFNGEEDSGSGL